MKLSANVGHKEFFKILSAIGYPGDRNSCDKAMDFCHKDAKSRSLARMRFGLRTKESMGKEARQGCSLGRKAAIYPGAGRRENATCSKRYLYAR